MTVRALFARGLIAGLHYAEMRRLQPGFVIDMFMARMQYDDQQHGIRRVRQPRCAD